MFQLAGSAKEDQVALVSGGLDPRAVRERPVRVGVSESRAFAQRRHPPSRILVRLFLSLESEYANAGACQPSLVRT